MDIWTVRNSRERPGVKMYAVIRDGVKQKQRMGLEKGGLDDLLQLHLIDSFQ